MCHKLRMGPLGEHRGSSKLKAGPLEEHTGSSKLKALEELSLAIRFSIY